tara:strand:+ start:1859 stop:2458 length:600 start_codon:yes stop_codon:yes gene_type:complete
MKEAEDVECVEVETGECIQEPLRKSTENPEHRDRLAAWSQRLSVLAKAAGPPQAEPEGATTAAKLDNYWKEVAMTISLAPFFFSSWPLGCGNGWIGWVVAYNGAVAHLSGAYGWKSSWLWGKYDTVVNMALIAYVNWRAAAIQPVIFCFTIFALVAWAANGSVFFCRSVFVHVVFLQWPLAAALQLYELHGCNKVCSVD